MARRSFQSQGLAFGPLLPAKDLLDTRKSIYSDYYTDQEYDALRAASVYAGGFLARPHATLGRAGPVCPFVSRAIRQQLLLVTACRTRSFDIDTMTAALLRLREALIEKRATLEDKDRIFVSIIATFPHLPPAKAACAIQRVQRRLKPDFVAAGLMIGEFYPGCPAPGLHSDSFRPLDAPLPFIAIRSITLQDAPFMLSEPRYRTAFIHFFGQAGRDRIAVLQDQQAACPAGQDKALADV